MKSKKKELKNLTEKVGDKVSDKVSGINGLGKKKEHKKRKALGLLLTLGVIGFLAYKFRETYTA